VLATFRLCDCASYFLFVGVFYFFILFYFTLFLCILFYFINFWGTFAKLREETIRLIILHFRPSGGMEQSCFRWTDFHEILDDSFTQVFQDNSSLVKIEQI